MSQREAIIFAGDTVWQISRDDELLQPAIGVSEDPAQVVATIAPMLDSSVGSVTLALPASWCFSTTVSLIGVPARNRHTTLLYQMEPLLPLAAEDIAADFILDEPTSALAICVSISRVKGLIDAFEAAEVFIDSIIPASVYAVQTLLSGGRENVDGVIWQSGNSVEIFKIKADRITGWYAFPAAMDDFQWHLDQVFEEGNPHRVIVRALQPELLAGLRARQSLQLVSDEPQSIESQVVSGFHSGVPRSVELRRDGLAAGNPLRVIRKPLNEFAIATVIMIACIVGAVCWRASRLEQLAGIYRLQQENLFREALPGRAIPANIVSRLRSEERGLKANSGNPENRMTNEFVLGTLHSILTGIDSLPPVVRLEVADLKINDAQFSLDGAVRDRADLAALVDSLGREMQLDAPQTEQLGVKAVHFNLTGSLLKEPTAK